MHHGCVCFAPLFLACPYAFSLQQQELPALCLDEIFNRAAIPPLGKKDFHFRFLKPGRGDMRIDIEQHNIVDSPLSHVLGQVRLSFFSSSPVPNQDSRLLSLIHKLPRQTAISLSLEPSLNLGNSSTLLTDISAHVNITELELSDQRLQQVAEQLSHLQRLETLSVCDMPCLVEEVVDLIRDADKRGVPEEEIDIPRLPATVKKLKIKSCWTEYDHHDYAVYQLLGRCGPSVLTTFILEDSLATNSTGIIDMMELCPQLDTLSVIGNRDMAKGLWTELTSADDCVRALAEALSENKTLVSLTLSCNYHSDDISAAEVMAELRFPPNLRRLVLAGNSLDVESVEALLVNLQNLKHLETLDLRDNDIIRAELDDIDMADEAHDVLHRVEIELE